MFSLNDHCCRIDLLSQQIGNVHDVISHIHRYQQLHPQATSTMCFLLLCEGGGHLRRRDIYSTCVCIKGIKKQTCPMGNTNLQGFISCTSLELIVAIHFNLRFSSTTNIFFGIALLNLIFFGLRTFDTFKYFFTNLYIQMYTQSQRAYKMSHYIKSFWTFKELVYVFVVKVV